MDAILNWIGGKSESAKKIVSLMPEHECYCEVFFGGGSVFFEKKPSKIEAINDINGELINFYRVIQRTPEKFIERSKYEMYSRSLYYEYLTDDKIRDLQEEGKSSHDIFIELNKHTETKVTIEHINKIMNTKFDEVERAFRFFCMIKEAFASKYGAGWGYSSQRNCATSFFNEFKIVDDITDRLKKAQIDNRDFEDVIDGWDNEKTLIFADPPYIKSISGNEGYYFRMVKKPFKMHDHQRLFNKLKNIKGKCILTIDDTPWIRERYTPENGFYTIQNEVYYCSGDKDSRRHEIELIITNYDTEKTQKHVDVRQSKLDF